MHGEAIMTSNGVDIGRHWYFIRLEIEDKSNTLQNEDDEAKFKII